MKNIFILAKKDTASYFHSWTGVLVMFSFAVISGVFFCLPVLTYAKLSLSAAQQNYQGLEGLGITRFVFSSYFLNIGTLLIFVVPFLSMRSFAEERNQETLELLFTYPFSDIDIVLGKFFGMLGFFLLLMSSSLLFVFFLRATGAQIDYGPVITGYLGFILLGMAYLSFGLFVSSISENQVVSAIVTFSVLVLFWLLEWVSGITDGKWAHFFTEISPFNHYRYFPLGILDLGHLVYFLFFYFYFLFLTMRVIETRHWKG